MRAARRRSAALALAVVLHALVILLVWKMRSNAALPETTENPFMMAIRIPDEPVRVEPRPTPERERRSQRTRAAPVPAPQGDEQRTGSITLPPETGSRIDWYREAEITVQAMDSQASLKSEPEVMKLPPRDTAPHKGDSGVLPNGNIVVQTSDTVRCESGPQFAADVFEIWARTAPVRCTYKARPKKELKLKDHDYGKEEEIPLP